MSRLRFQVALFTVIRLVFNIAHRMVYPFLGVIARGLGVDLPAMSLALTARAVIGTIGPFAATVADSRSRKFGMLLGVGIFSLGSGVVVFFPTLIGLTVSLVLTSLGKYIFDPGMQAYLGDRIEYERRGLAIAITEMGWSLAYVVGIPLVGLIIARQGWMAPFPLFALLGGLSFAALFFLLPGVPLAAPSSNGAVANFRLVLISAAALAGLSISMLTSAGNELVNIVFGVWLEESFGLKIAALGLAAAVIGVSELTGEGLVAGFVDRIGKPRAVGLGLAANSLAALLLPLLGRTEPGALIGLSFFYLSFEFTMVSLIPMMTEVLPAARATLLAFNVAAFSLGRAVGAPLAPLLYSHGLWAITLATAALNLVAIGALRVLSVQPGAVPSVAVAPSDAD
jgi:MFS transporter, DHA1 family, inner membrane transport protein